MTPEALKSLREDLGKLHHRHMWEDTRDRVLKWLGPPAGPDEQTAEQAWADLSALNKELHQVVGADPVLDLLHKHKVVE